MWVCVQSGRKVLVICNVRLAFYLPPPRSRERAPRPTSLFMIFSNPRTSSLHPASGASSSFSFFLRIRCNQFLSPERLNGTPADLQCLGSRIHQYKRYFLLKCKNIRSIHKHTHTQVNIYFICKQKQATVGLSNPNELGDNSRLRGKCGICQ